MEETQPLGVSETMRTIILPTVAVASAVFVADLRSLVPLFSTPGFVAQFQFLAYLLNKHCADISTLDTSVCKVIQCCNSRPMHAHCGVLKKKSVFVSSAQTSLSYIYYVFVAVFWGAEVSIDP